MSIANEITRLQNAKASIKTSIENKGVTVPSTTKLDDYSSLIDDIPSGGGKYTPRRISFTNYTGTELNYELDNLDTSNLQSYNSMFQTCQQLISVDLAKIPINNINDGAFNNMFYYNKALTTISNVKNYINNKAVNIANFFNNCIALTGKLDLSEWDTTNITTMQQTFYNCSGLTEIDVSGWSTPRLTTVSNMFAGCTSLQKIDMRNFNFSNIASSGGRNSIFGNSLTSNNIPANCLIIVKDATQKSIITNWNSWLTNVKTVAEL